MEDTRWEVRTEAAYAAVRLKRRGLVPKIIEALETERSHTGANRLLYSLQHFNDHPMVKQFMKDYQLPKWFEKTPDYHRIYDDVVDEFL
jgi:hypothetical protein